MRTHARSASEIFRVLFQISSPVRKGKTMGTRSKIILSYGGPDRTKLPIRKLFQKKCLNVAFMKKTNEVISINETIFFFMLLFNMRSIVEIILFLPKYIRAGNSTIIKYVDNDIKVRTFAPNDGYSSEIKYLFGNMTKNVNSI